MDYLQEVRMEHAARLIRENELTNEQICEAVGADSLGFVSVDGIHDVAGLGEIGICDACFTGNYPMQVDEREYFNKYDFKIGEQPNV